MLDTVESCTPEVVAVLRVPFLQTQAASDHLVGVVAKAQAEFQMLERSVSATKYYAYTVCASRANGQCQIDMRSLEQNMETVIRIIPERSDRVFPLSLSQCSMAYKMCRGANRFGSTKSL
jgi:hypothetical protein